MNQNEKFEIKAQLFYNDTGLMAPGTNISLQYGIAYKIRLSAWNVWTEAYGELIDKVLNLCSKP
jgi:hypothetical protein